MKKKILLTPDKAREFLAHNYSGNRKIAWNTVSAYAADISADRWNPDISEFDQPIAFSAEGELINGQHRCSAVILANKSVYTWIVTDVPLELYQYMDCGKVRQASDFLPVPNSLSIAALAKFVCAVEEGNTTLYQAVNGVLKFVPGKGKNYVRVTRTQIIQKVEEQNDYLQEIFALGQRASKYFGNKKGPFANAFYVIDFVGKGALLQEFAEECSKIRPDSDLISNFRTYITTRLLNKNFHATPQWIMGCIFYTYDHFIEDSKIGSFNKADTYFEKYSALMNKERNKRKGE